MIVVVYFVVCFAFNNVESLCHLSQAVERLTSCLGRRGPHWMTCDAVNGSLHCTLFREADFHLWEQDYGSSSEGKSTLEWTFSCPTFLFLENKGRCFFVSLTGMGRQLSWSSEGEGNVWIECVSVA